jgi:N-glycosylase/DNA lyase
MELTSIFKIHDTVLKVSNEAKRLLPQKRVYRSERKLLEELIFCILSSQERYEIALAASKRLTDGTLDLSPRTEIDLTRLYDEVSHILSQPFSYKIGPVSRSAKIRSGKRKTHFIVDTVGKIGLGGSTIRQLVDSGSNSSDTREKIVNAIAGIGPKQASMFLRNIGLCVDLAILDKHVVDYMNIMALMNPSKFNFSRLNEYEEAESRLQAYAFQYGVEMLHLDIAIWTTMRTLQRYK